MLGEHVGGGNYNGSQLVQCQHRDPPFQTAFQDEHHHVAMADAQ